MNNQNSAFGKTSPCFTGTIGQTILPQDFPASNYLIDTSRYDYEANWAFCVFDSDEVPAARFGFGRGRFDFSDYGLDTPCDPSFLMLQIELMTREGAALWLASSRFKADNIRHDCTQMDIEFKSADQTVFRIKGWPQMNWQFESDDREIAVDMRLDVQNVTILPDCVMPRNWFAMWLAICHAEGTVHFQDKTTRLTGTAFYDHPRLLVQPNAAPPFGWYLYTPIRFADGSYLVSYFAQDGNGNRVDEYSFGLYINRDGVSHWLATSDVTQRKFDGDGRLQSWQTTWRGSGIECTAEFVVRPTDIRKIWGGQTVPRTRREYSNVPLVFDCQATMHRDSRVNHLAGIGLAEYLPRATVN